MPYSTQDEVETWGYLSSSELGSRGYNYDNTIAYLIQVADGKIDAYCNVPKAFFDSGGVTVKNEYLNGVDVVYLGGISKFFGWYYGGTSHLKFKYPPVLSVSKLEEETSANTWTTRTEGTGNDYIVVDDGVRWVTNTPAWKYKNVRVTYKAGYKETPDAVAECSARLAAAIGQRIVDSKTRVSSGNTPVDVNIATEHIGLGKAVFTKELKKLVEPYKRVVYAVT